MSLDYKKIKEFWEKINKIFDCIKGNDSGSYVEEKKGMIKKVFDYIKISWLFWLQVVIIILFFLILLNKIPFFKQDNIYKSYELATLFYTSSIILVAISKLIIQFGTKQNIYDYKQKVKLLINFYYYKYNINLLIFILLSFIVIYFVLCRILGTNIHFFPLLLVFLTLLTFLALLIEPDKYSMFSVKRLNYIISSFYFPLIISILVLFLPFLIKPYFTDIITRFSISKDNIIYGNGESLGYIIPSSNIKKTLNCKYKISKNILNNSTFSISTGGELYINNEDFCLLGNKYSQLIIGTIHLFTKNKYFISFKNNSLNGQFYGIKINNITGNIQDLEKIYSDTLNSKYISVHESGKLLFSSLLTLFLFSLTILFWRAYKKEYNNYKKLLNKLIKIETLLSEEIIIDEKFTQDLKTKLRENPEELLPLLPIDDEENIDSKLLDKIKNTIEEIIKSRTKNNLTKNPETFWAIFLFSL